MDPTRLVLDTAEAFVKAFSAALGKSFVTVKVRLVTPKDRTDPEAKDQVSFAIINESGPDIEVQEAWFVTTYNRRIFSTVLNSKMPIRVRKRDRATYFLPIEELKAALNERVGETITQAAVFDKTGHQYQSRVDSAFELKLAAK